MLIVFFYYEGIVHHEYAHTGQTINKEYCVEVLKRLRNAIRRKRPQLWESGDWLLHHDNAPAHTSNLVQQCLSKHSIAQLRQPPYSPDIAPCDFWLFPRLKMPLKDIDSTINRLLKLMRRMQSRRFRRLTFKSALISGNIDMSNSFNQMGTTLKDATPRMTKNKLSAEKPK
ncbi:uncharacterized protein TNCV_3117581 [Trichonephila clavipes]|uniref:Transposase n=1 Tax=Trichonephila clavipes TaxID=2585209 RepID=A0A8X6WAI5_TRICX|nr:uncharacterized protein TNCV_3117581 [Trichonephila clavipes]